MGRIFHAACCLNYGEEHPQLMVSAGMDKGNNTLRDLLVLDVEAGTWKEVRGITWVECLTCTKLLASFPGPRARFHFSTATGLVHFLTCVTRRVEGWCRRVNFCVGEDSCSSQTTKEGSESILLAATLFGARLCHRPSAKTMSPAEGREVQPSFEWSLPTHN